MKLSDLTSDKIYLTSYKPSSLYEQTYADIIKWPLLKSPEKSSHASQFTKYLCSTILEGETFLQIKKWCYAISSSFCQYASISNIWTAWKHLTEDNHKISSSFLPLDTHPNSSPAKKLSSILKINTISSWQIWHNPFL